MKRIITVLFWVIMMGVLFASCVQSVSPDHTEPSEVIDYSKIEETEPTIESVISEIDDRVSWIDEGLGGYPFQGDELLALGDFEFKNGEIYKDYYDGDDLVYRRGSEFYDKIEGDVFYNLYYNTAGHLIYANITQYRHPSYCIYFSDDAAIRLTQGDRGENESESVFDEDMLHAVALCLENAYQ